MPSCRYNWQGYGVGFGVGRTLSKRVEKSIHGYDEREFLPYAFEAYRCRDDVPKRPFQILQGRQLQVFSHRTAVQSILYNNNICVYFCKRTVSWGTLFENTRKFNCKTKRMSAHYCFLSLFDRDIDNLRSSDPVSLCIIRNNFNIRVNSPIVKL